MYFSALSCHSPGWTEEKHVNDSRYTIRQRRFEPDTPPPPHPQQINTLLDQHYSMKQCIKLWWMVKVRLRCFVTATALDSSMILSNVEVDLDYFEYYPRSFWSARGICTEWPVSGGGMESGTSWIPYKSPLCILILSECNDDSGQFTISYVWNFECL
jgi:hypothetical protein